MDELLYVLTQYFVSCVHVRFSFSLLLIFTLLAASISYFLSAPLNFHVFLPTKFVSFVFNNSLQLFPVSVNIKNDVEKDMTFFFFSKSPGSRVISFQIKPSVAFGLPDLLTELFYIGMPVVRTDSRVVSRSVYGHVITKFSWMGRLPHFLSNGVTPTRGAQLISLWKLQLAFSPTQNNTKRNDSSILFGREKKF